VSGGAHHPAGLPAAEPRTPKVHVEDVIEILERALLDRAAYVDACGVDEDVERPEALDDAGKDGGDVLLVGDVEGPADALLTRAVRNLLRTGAADRRVPARQDGGRARLPL